MDDLQRLVAIEDIRQVKARYWQAVDLKNAALLRSVFTDDAIIDLRADALMSDPPSEHTPSPDEFVNLCLTGLAAFETAHHGHSSQITFSSESEAEGVWAMEDNLWPKEPAATGHRHINGHGIYFDRYRKTAGAWRICATTLRRLHLSRG